jgi:hypothetical protein
METVLELSICGGLIGYLVFLAKFWFLSAKAYSNLVRFEYENNPDQWPKDGEPIGMFFWKPKTPYKTFILTRATLGNPGIRMLIFLFFTPKWIKEHPEAHVLLRDLRRNALWRNIGILILILLPYLLVIVNIALNR